MSNEIKKVFISSPYSDLIDYRTAAIKSINRFEWFAIAMEDFVAQDDRPKDLCINLVGQCQIYILILAHRYGSIPSGENLSITELEYIAAQKNGTPCLVFLINDEYPWLKKWIDTGKVGDKLNKFRVHLLEKHECSIFKSPDDLAAKISAALAKYIKELLLKQLHEYAIQPPSIPDSQIPDIHLHIYNYKKFPTDVRCQVINKSAYPVSIKTKVNAKLGKKVIDLPIPRHYSGDVSWDIPARNGFEGHFDFESHILKKYNLTYLELKNNPQEFELSINYSASDKSGTWHDLGSLRYYFDFIKEQWLIKV